ncbi:hypothetical protein AQF52_6113 [Streptomyces venezuelae]|uniref:hypothetical protein n=1 Tax=Streptomyces gardneri TaxID=66892 RepID=UPI0006BDDE9F|nr:hypothetical protein [Streptomyces gardneri]ALO11706.1 hypothetical protein AQF52_6113 [Streptomyces venezuelae]QPK50987.1 hypothetical protein H4W23_30710 [Streptomyces gardneri]WRK42275.1 hypothetical protein U0M97_30860 [Streptomyces venezuelae]CUM37746.1 hypothetical protein BN2537_4457 [Streptomyces venezuelae]
MDGFLGKVTEKLAERWLALLVWPGVLFLAAAAAARALGQRHPFDPHRPAAQVTAWAEASSARSLGGQVILLAAVLAAAAVVGMVARGLGSVVERLALAADWETWPGPARALAGRLVHRRGRRWLAARTAYDEAREAGRLAVAEGGRVDSAALRRLRADLLAVGEEEPDRPTWSGDQVHGVVVRFAREDVDLPLLWPYLWLVLPPPTRTELSEARAAIASATALASWAPLYALLAWWWWPAAPLAAVLAVVARGRIRSAISDWATLVEATARLHLPTLARRLDLAVADRTADRLGGALTLQLGTVPPPRTGLDSSAMPPGGE